ncbi:MAG: AAA family ATPase, partial [Treponema sp.]
RAYEKTGKQAVVLVDEYDKPLLETMHDDPELNETYRKILKGFYGVIKSSDEYLRFAFLTGVTKFSKVSIFSDLNNLRDISMLPDFSAICGITQEELEAAFIPEIEQLALANNLSVEQTLAELKQWYDGYHFCENSINVYNPFSILNVFAGKVFRSFWFATGTPTFLVKSLLKQGGDVRELFEEAEMSESALQDYRPDMQNPVPILFQSGYLTIKGFDPEFRLYKLGFPNAEVKYGFLDNLVPAYTAIQKDQSGLFIGNFVRDIRKGNVAGFMERLYVSCAGLPYSFAAKDNVKLRERDYQVAFYVLFTLMGQFTQTEVVSSRGRADAVVYTPNTIYV